MVNNLRVRFQPESDEPTDYVWGASRIPNFQLPVISKPGFAEQRYWDPLLEVMQDMMFFSHVYSNYDMYNRIRPDYQDINIRFAPPVTSNYDFVEDYLSSQNLGAFGVIKLITALQGGFTRAVDAQGIKREHNCEHTTLSGVADWKRKWRNEDYPDGPVIDMRNEDDLYRYGSISVPQLGEPMVSRSRVTVQNGRITGTSHLHGDPAPVKGDILYFLQYLERRATRKMPWIFQAYHGFTCTITYTKLQYSYDIRRGSIKVRSSKVVTFDNDVNQLTYMEDVALDIKRDFAVNIEPLGSYYNHSPSSMWAHIVMTADRTVLNNDTYFYVEPHWSLSLQSLDCFFGSSVHHIDETKPPVRPTFERLYRGADMPFKLTSAILDVDAVHANNCRHVLGDLKPGLALAAHAAFDEYLNVLSTNHIETLSELTDLGRMFPNPKGLISLFKAIRKKDLWNTVGTLADIISSTKLSYSFGLDPTSDSMREFAENFDRIKSDLTPTLGVRTLYGRKVFSLPEEDFGGPTVYTAQAKVVINFTENSLLSTLLSLNSIGLAPTMSNLWDVFPLSFIVDWFFNIGDRLAAIDSEVLLLCFEHMYTTYSITVSSDLSHDTLNVNNLESGAMTSFDIPRITWYKRIVTQFQIPYGSSKYDLIGNQGIPDDQLLVSSLAYQLLKPSR